LAFNYKYAARSAVAMLHHAATVNVAATYPPGLKSGGRAVLFHCDGALHTDLVLVPLSNSEEWAKLPKDLIKFVVMKPMSCPHNRHQTDLSEMCENTRCSRIRKETFLPAQQ
jgi:hypothetical protein